MISHDDSRFPGTPVCRAERAASFSVQSATPRAMPGPESGGDDSRPTLVVAMDAHTRMTVGWHMVS